MREPIYKPRPVAPFSARFGGERINDFIVMSEGNSNCYLLQSSEGDIQINAGMAFEAPVHHANFTGFSSRDLRYLILTQGHVDHLGGVQYFRDHHPGVEVIAQSGNAEHQAYDGRLSPFRAKRSAFAFGDKFTAAFRYYAEHGLSDFPPQDVPTPDITFDHRHRFTLGGLDVELIAVPGAETNDSLIVWLPQHRICLTGNLFGCPFGHFPNLVTIRGDRYREALTCAAAVQVVLDLAPETILYGHHAPVCGEELIANELTILRDAIHYVHDKTIEGMNEGKTVHQLMAEIDLPSDLEVGQGYGKVSWSVRAIWESYAGWFHHQSTTELYAVPQCAVYDDLLHLAGAEALIERAAEKVLGGQLPEALHLLDIVLSAQPQQSEALSLAIDCHRKLLQQADNFWLESWLEKQISQLSSRLEMLS